MMFRVAAIIAVIVVFLAVLFPSMNTGKYGFVRKGKIVVAKMFERKMCGQKVLLRAL